MFSKVVHGLSVPIGKLGYRLPRTLSSAFGSTHADSDPEEPEPPFRLRERVPRGAEMRLDRDRRIRDEPPGAIFRIGGSVIQSPRSDAATLGTTTSVRPVTPADEIASDA